MNPAWLQVLISQHLNHNGIKYSKCLSCLSETVRLHRTLLFATCCCLYFIVNQYWHNKIYYGFPQSLEEKALKKKSENIIPIYLCFL